MPWKSNSDIWGFVGALIISVVSGFISISRRILNGHTASILWVISEILASVLCGYLAYYTYPYIQHNLPEWATWPVCVSFGAYIGGRVIQNLEDAVLQRWSRILITKSIMEKKYE